MREVGKGKKAEERSSRRRKSEKEIVAKRRGKNRGNERGEERESLAYRARKRLGFLLGSGEEPLVWPDTLLGQLEAEVHQLNTVE